MTKKAKGPIITINYKRVIEVWMDEEYKKFFYTRCYIFVIDVFNMSQKYYFVSPVQGYPGSFKMLLCTMLPKMAMNFS